MRSTLLDRLPGRMLRAVLVGACLAAATWPSAAGEVPDSGGWSTGAPRDEIRPEFACESGGGPGHDAVLVIRAGQRDGVDGYWTKTFPVTGGRSLSLRRALRDEGRGRAAAQRRGRDPLEGRERPARPAR